jgi:hypothetical protein
VPDRDQADIYYRRATQIGSDIDPLGEHQGILDVNAEIANRCLDLGMPQENLNRSQIAGPLLDDDRARLHRTPADDIANRQFHQIAATQLAVDGEVEQSAIPEPLLMIEGKPDRPDMLQLEGAFGAQKAASILGPAVIVSGVKAGSSHDVPPASPSADDD